MPAVTPFIIDQNTFPPAKFATFATLLNIVLPLLMIGAALLLLVLLLYGAFVWITAGDNPENVKKSQKIITYGLTGLMIVILSFLVVKIIGIVFNINTVIPLK